MRLAIILLLCSLTLGFAIKITDRNINRYGKKEDVLKQQFLLEIVHRVADPLGFKKWIKLGKELITDESKYTKYDDYMNEFAKAQLMGTALPKDDFFGATVLSHMHQARGLFHFFYFASDWDTFQRNVCWARIHVNPGMFVYALYLTVVHHEQFKGFVLPQIYEIFPQHFFNAHFIYKAAKFDAESWDTQAKYEEKYEDIFHKDRTDLYEKPLYLQDWKQWQWWKLMGLEERWYIDENDEIVGHNTDYLKNEQLSEALVIMKFLWMPVDYTRDLKILNPESMLSYLTEDVEINAAWYYMNLDTAVFLDDEDFAVERDRRSEWWMFVSRMFLARFRLERLSHGLGGFPPLARNIPIKTGYNPQLISWNGVPFLQRYNNYDYTDYGFGDIVEKTWRAFGELYKAMDTGHYPLKNGTSISMFTREGYKYFMSMLQGNVNAFTCEDFRFYYYDSYNYFAWNDPSQVFDVLPSTFLNFETMWRDPHFASYVNAEIFDRYKAYMKKYPPYTKEELKFEGVWVDDVELDELVTFFDYTDYDVSNLMNDKMSFTSGQYQWIRALYARQQRLNHKPFGYKLHVHADQAQAVVVRAFLGPKFNEEGRLYSLQENWQNFYQFDQFVTILGKGDQVVTRDPDDKTTKHPHRLSQSELYNLVVLSLENDYIFPMSYTEPHNIFKHRLALPKGWADGFPVQFFFIVTPHKPSNGPYEDFDWEMTARFLDDDLNMGFPFDRYISDEANFMVNNIYSKDAKIYHVDYADKYAEGYDKYGQFDYDYWRAKDIKL